MSFLLKAGDIAVTIIMIPYNNHDKFKLRLAREILPTIVAHPTWIFQLVVVDNSDLPNASCCQMLEGYNVTPCYHWPGLNLRYGPAMNLAVQMSTSPYLVYVCSTHGHMYESNWIDDLIAPLIEDNNVAMTGSYYPSCNPAHMNFPAHLPRIHIQGGVFGANTNIMKNFPYTSDPRWVHGGSDVYQCFQLVHAGFHLYNVPTIKSVWQQRITEPEKWKYVHEYSGE